MARMMRSGARTEMRPNRTNAQNHGTMLNARTAKANRDSASLIGTLRVSFVHIYVIL